MIFLYKYWFRKYLRTRANTRAPGVFLTPGALFRQQKTYFLLSEGSKSVIIMLFLFTELDSIKNITMSKKLPETTSSDDLITKHYISRYNFFSFITSKAVF